MKLPSEGGGHCALSLANKLPSCVVSRRAVRQSARISVKVARLRMKQLMEKESCSAVELGDIFKQLKEIHRLGHELMRKGDEKNARRIIHLRHLLRQQLEILVQNSNFNSRNIMDETGEECIL